MVIQCLSRRFSAEKARHKVASYPVTRDPIRRVNWWNVANVKMDLGRVEKDLQP